MGLDIDFCKVPKSAVNPKVVEVHERFGALSENGCSYMIDYPRLSDNPEKEEVHYYRKWHDVRNTMAGLFDATNQCDYYLLTKEDVALLLENVENSDDWLLESERVEFIAMIKSKLIDFPFDTHYLTYSWIS
ncbi:hypothetical protein CPT_Moabite_245 [Serratia phage Moabite]|uniref:Uncharacterized protein n=1 Tax=Serratia phage Moabite TaxID=2587814 RepID=A0A4Y5TPG4_9CAUD|nr:hypothetical protein HWC48_gp171 [Serratia phage Moabite]QDB71275.1 hypothetical protein CPT_Moabite_245 [Serratia phage Moabite]